MIAGCATNDDPATDDPVESSPAETEPDDGDNEGNDDEGASADDCFIHFFDGEDFDETDDNFKLTEPGEYENLGDLPGADKDWTDEADSFKIGDSASVTIFTEENFEGESQDLDPGTEVADADDEPVSLKMTCD